jgi:hypothetical protein
MHRSKTIDDLVGADKQRGRYGDVGILLALVRATRLTHITRYAGGYFFPVLFSDFIKY